MAADDPGEIACAGQELDFFEKINRLIVFPANLARVAIELLGESYLNTEIGGLSELGQLQSLRTLHPSRDHAGALEMALGKRRGIAIGSRHVLDIMQQILRHPHMLAAYRTVSYWLAAAAHQRAGRAWQHGTVDDGQ